MFCTGIHRMSSIASTQGSLIKKCLSANALGFFLPPSWGHNGFGAKVEALNVKPDLTTMRNCNTTALV